MSARAMVFILVAVVGTGCGSLEVAPLTADCDLPSGQLVRGYVTVSGAEHVEDGYLSCDESGTVRFSPLDSAAVHILPPGEVTGALVRGPDRVGPAVLDALVVAGVVVLYAGVLLLDVWLDHELRCGHR